MFRHPLWLVGFRPFFTLAFVFGALLPLWWALVYAGQVPLPATGLAPFQWHAYEMLYGFGWAVLAGFLLTASKNWVKVRGIHGGPLALMALLWLLERAAILAPPGGALGVVRWVGLNAFGVSVVGYILWTLIRYRDKDFYRSDNRFFVVGLPVFLVARNLMHLQQTWVVGELLSVGIYRLAFVLMFERTLPDFMKATHQVVLPRRPWLDLPIKALVLLAAFEALLPAKLAAGVLGLAAVLLFARVFTWKPLVGLSTFGIGVMYVGYLALVTHLGLSAAQYAGLLLPQRSLSLHVFFFLCMGVIIPAMLLRICQGHTGRKPEFKPSDKLAIGLVGVAAALRLFAIQLWPLHYATWIAAAAVCWSACFVIIGVRVGPFLWRPRTDGREH